MFPYSFFQSSSNVPIPASNYWLLSPYIISLPVLVHHTNRMVNTFLCLNSSSTSPFWDSLILLCVSLVPFYYEAAFQWMTISHITNGLLSYWGTFGLFPRWSYYEHYSFLYMSLCGHVLISLPRSGSTGSWESCMISFALYLSNIQYCHS